MGDNSNADFSGYATKANVKCSDGKTISPLAFAHMDQMQLPLVYQHGHNNIENVLGHAVLEARKDGVYAYGFFNGTKQGQNAREYVQHKDIKAMSIYANKLVMKGQTVVHGEIREVSLVLAGANPEAVIDYVQLKHSDDPNDIEVLTDEAVIHTGLEIEVVLDKKLEEPVIQHAAPGATVQDVLDTFNDDQKEVLAIVVSEALAAKDAAIAQTAVEPKPDEKKPEEGINPDDKKPEEGVVVHQEGTGSVTNVFEQADKNKIQHGDGVERHLVSHSDLKTIFEDAKKSGSLRTAVEGYALQHGIENIEALFPDPKTLNNTPDFNSRNMAWVQGVIDGTRKSPFARIKSITADITQDEARAKGYITGTYKKEEWYALTSRSTTPTTIYKKQKLDRNNIVDITDFDVVSWLKLEMRIMLMEEIAVAILVGDGRDVDDPDHINDPMAASSGEGIRSIINENELYATQVNVNVDDANSSYSEVVDQVMTASEFYKGTGRPTFYSTQRTINKMLLTRDANLRRMYANIAELAAAMNVDSIVAVDPMDRFPNLLGIVVNLTDYNVGTDKGGEVNMFDDFDIDYNQYKYLIETRMSGAMVKIKAALIINKTASGNVLVSPTAPTFVSATGVTTIPTQTGVVYKNADTNATLSAGAQTALAAGATLKVKALPASGYFFAVTGQAGVDEWTFKRPAA